MIIVTLDYLTLNSQLTLAFEDCFILVILIISPEEGFTELHSLARVRRRKDQTKN